MKTSLQLISIFSCTFLLSCESNRTDVDIITPENEQGYHTGDTIEVKAGVNDADEITKEFLTATSENGDTIFSFTNYPRTDSNIFKKRFPATSSGNYKITLSAYGESFDSESVMVNVN